MNKKNLVREIYNKLYKHFGPRKWWPADSPFEVMVGAILTQNTSWKNVEIAILNLKKKSNLSPYKILKMPERSLSTAIKPSGFYRQKTKRLKGLSKFILKKYSANINKLKSHDIPYLRKEFLSLNGIGPETADSILLYALEKPVFVVDAYTRRIFSRHGVIKKEFSYEKIAEVFTDKLSPEAKLFNEYHALIVETAKRYCKKKKPQCDMCPLGSKKMGKNLRNMV